MGKDRNFDEIFDRFHHRIKNNKKGLLREALIREDLMDLVLTEEQRPLSILDSGCGLGDMSLWLAQKGHQVLATDISARMVAHTQALAEEQGLAGSITVRQQSVQDVLSLGGQSFDLICIHAVMEWLHAPYDLLPLIPACLKPGGFLSLTIYNRHRSVFNSLIKGDFNKIMAANYAGSSNAMTPPHPIEPERVQGALQSLQMDVLLQAGLRCFYDYFPNKAKDEHSLEDLLTLERRFRKLAPYRDFARYVHFVARKGG